MKIFIRLGIAVFLTFIVLSPCFSVDYFSGDGGKNISIAIYEPQPHGDIPKDQLVYIQGLLKSNFNKFSAVRLIEQQHIDKIISEQDIAVSGRYSDEDYIKIGALANAQYFLFGTIQNISANRYRIQLSITDSSEGIRKVTFLKEGALSALLFEATEYLLNGLGIELTAEGKQELQKLRKEAELAEQKREKEATQASRATTQAQKKQERKTAQAERSKKASGTVEKIKSERGKYAERSYVGAGLYAQMSPNETAGGGIEAELYIPLLPFLTTGVSGRIGALGVFDDDGFKFSQDEGNAFNWVVSPVIGIVWPANKTIRVYSDILLDFGKFGYLSGVFNDWFTLSFDAGVELHIFGKNALSLKYRGSFYKDNIYTNSVCLGISMWWND
ncbi:MAG: hypothetical protein LBH16_12230 [Treponema sp.]|jgi:hypothetical protein|nr:hypothetical protein [Treponema sp.]